MKKVIITLLLILFCTSIISGCTSFESKEDGEIVYSYEEVKDTLIRFHVIANSDTDKDQELKLKVRDKVIEYLYPYLKDSNSLDESRKIIKEQERNIRDIADKVILDNGYSYSVKTELSHENFPEKSYGNIILPQGNYEAFRIIIGNGKGQNWWCVMFPPLCFIDITKGKVEEDESRKELDEQIEKEKESHEEEDEEPVIGFKLFEFIKSIFG